MPTFATLETIQTFTANKTFSAAITFSAAPIITASSMAFTAGANFTLGTTDNFALLLRTNNLERMRIDNAGNIGIGTATPLVPLHIKTNTGSNAFIIEKSTDTVSLHVIDENPSFHARYRQRNASSVVTTQISASDVSFFNGGNVGIGTASPTALLHLGGDQARPFSIQKSTVSVVAPGAGIGMLRWENGTNAGTLKLVAYSGTSTTGVTIVDNVGSGN